MFAKDELGVAVPNQPVTVRCTLSSIQTKPATLTPDANGYATFTVTNNGGAMTADEGYVVKDSKGTVVKSGTINTAIFTLPAGFRPSKTILFAVTSNALFGYVEVQADGTMKSVNGGIVGFFSCEMSAEQLATRILAEQTRIASSQIRRGGIDQRLVPGFLIGFEQGHALLEQSGIVPIQPYRDGNDKAKEQNEKYPPRKPGYGAGREEQKQSDSLHCVSLL